MNNAAPIFFLFPLYYMRERLSRVTGGASALRAHLQIVIEL